MATNYKYVNVQGTAGVTTYATLYSTGASTQAVVSTISVANTAATGATFRVALMSSAGTPTAANAVLAWDTAIGANDTYFITAGIAMQANQFIRVSSSANTVTFSAFVSEIT